MLTIPNGTSEQETLQRIKQARGTAEPTTEPTEEPSIVNMSDDIPDEITEEAEELQDVIEEPEEVEEVEEIAQPEDEEELYLDLDGEEVSLSQIRDWKNGNMMQSDYTRKTTELSEQRKEIEQKEQTILAKQQEIDGLAAQLEALINDGELSPEEVKELREYEPEEYIKYIERQQTKKDALSKVKLNKSPSFDPQLEQQKLFNANPQWLDNGKPTRAYEQDSALINDYAAKNGITAEKFASFDANMINMMLDAARFNNKQDKAAAVTKKVRKAPLATKPQQAAKQGIQARVAEAEKRFKKNPTDANAVALRKIKRQLNN